MDHGAPFTTDNCESATCMQLYIYNCMHVADSQLSVVNGAPWSILSSVRSRVLPWVLYLDEQTCCDTNY